MHIRTVSRVKPQSASNVQVILDIVTQMISLVNSLQATLSNVFHVSIGQLVGKGNT